MFWVFGRKVCGILAPWPGIEPTPIALEGEILTTGAPGKSLDIFLSNWCYLKFFKLKYNIYTKL